MVDQTLFHYQMERSRSSAILYIGGIARTSTQINTITRLINDLPRATRVLRVDLHGVVSITLQTLMDLRAALARWRTERNANVRLVLRTPIPREEWPDDAIHFERAPLRLVAPSRKSELVQLLLHRVATVALTGTDVLPRARAHLTLAGVR